MHFFVSTILLSGGCEIMGFDWRQCFEFSFFKAYICEFILLL